MRDKKDRVYMKVENIFTYTHGVHVIIIRLSNSFSLWGSVHHLFSKNLGSLSHDPKIHELTSPESQFSLKVARKKQKVEFGLSMISRWWKRGLFPICSMV